MQRREGFLSVFLVVLFLCLAFLGLSISGKLKFLSFLDKPSFAIQRLSYNLFQKLPFVSEDFKIKRLRDENLGLLSRLADFEKLKKENAALSDQFQTAYPSSLKLLKAQIIGAPNFILDKGAKDGLKIGQGVVVKNNLIGIIAKVSVNLAKVNLLGNPSFSFTAKTENGAIGIIKGEGDLTLDNVLLSENLKAGELVLTRGDIDFEGIYIPPDLIVGKIISVEKNPSSLFQKAKIESFVNFAKLSTVFVYLDTK